MSFKKSFSTALFTILGLSGLAHASNENVSPVVEILKSSSWSGRFEAKDLHGNISIRFLPSLGKGNELQYFHTIEGGGALGEALGPFDKSCEFTPRTLTVTGIKIRYGFNGTIKTYDCAKSQQDEADRQNDRSRQPSKTIPVEQLSFSEDGKTLTIVTKIAGINVTYTLKKNEPPSSAAQTKARSSSPPSPPKRSRGAQ